MMISDGDLLRIAEEICFSLFDPDVPVETAGVGTNRMMNAIVDINGEWNGSVSVRCARTTAESIASVMFDQPAAELANDDVIDALGEFANMAAGAIKAMLPGDEHLGLPTVGEGIDYVMVVPHTTELVGVDYALGDGSLRLSVRELTPR